MPAHIDQDARRGEALRDAASTTPSAEAPRARRRFLIVHNPLAGRNRVAVVQDVVHRLVQAGAIVDLHNVSTEETNEGLNERVGYYDAIVASGGDGTVRGLARQLQGRATPPFALIPVGTGNVLAAELNLPRDAAGIARMLLHGPIVHLSTASVNGAPFLLMIGAGLDGEIIARLPLALKRRVGRLAYGWPVMAALARAPQRFTAMVDGEACEASWLIVANAARYGGRFVLSPRTGVLAPGFNVVISHATRRGERLWELLNLAVGRLESVGTIEMRPAHSVELRDAGTIAVQVDGEPIAASSYSIASDAGTIAMIVPSTFLPSINPTS